jgi:ABC-type nitrate/sulfonate/bicarbonate transport system permease component
MNAGTVPAPTAFTRRRARGRLLRIGLPLIPFAVLLAAWVVGWQVAEPNLATFPSVGQVWRTVERLTGNGELQDNVVASVLRWSAGFAVGAITGAALGVLAGLNRFVARLIEPLAVFFTAMSGIVWIPLAIVWFGIGTATVVFVIWNAVFFMVFANTLLGVRSVQPVLEDAARTLGAGRAHIVTRVVIPGAMPHILSGLRSGAGFGWRALIAAEIIGASAGLGAMIYQAKEFLRSDVIVTGVIMIGLIGLALDMLVLAPIERRTIERWGLVETGSGGR